MDSAFITPEEEHSKFRTDGYGKYIIVGLFFELAMRNKEHVMYTLRQQPITRNGKLLPSIKQLYLEMEDVTEYEFANAYFDGWDHWKALCSSPTVGPEIEKWREELELKLRARGMKTMLEAAKDPEKGRAAAEYLIEKKWDKKRGRPSAQEKAKEAKKQGQLSTQYSSDLARISKLQAK